MSKIISKEKIIEYFIIAGFIIIPLNLYLKPSNFYQLNNLDIFYLFLAQFLISSLILLFSYLIHNFFLKNKILLFNFIISNFFIFYIFFFYNKFIFLFKKFNDFFFLLDNFIVLIIYFIIYLTILLFLKKNNKIIKNFFLVFIVLNIIFSLSKFTTDYFNEGKDIFSNNEIKLSDKEIRNNQKYNNIYIIVLDAMINLEKAKKEGVLREKNEIISELKRSGFEYNEKFNSNYATTHLSMATLLYGNYILNEKSKRYKNRNDFFPSLMLNEENDFYNILKKVNANFFWIGNEWGQCIPTFIIKCINKKSSLFILKTAPLYKDNILSYFFEYYLNKYNINAYDFLLNQKKYKALKSYKKNNFYLIHAMKPHPPFDLNKNCKKIKPILDLSNREYYSFNYNCVLKVTLKWIENNLNQNHNNLVLIMGDHGYGFRNEEGYSQFYKEKINNVFFSYKVPKKCKNLQIPNSHVNVMRFILNCMYDSNFEYLDDFQYFIHLEEHKDYGKVYKMETIY